jgi:hypothetical protein
MGFQAVNGLALVWLLPCVLGPAPVRKGILQCCSLYVSMDDSSTVAAYDMAAQVHAASQFLHSGSMARGIKYCALLLRTVGCP